MVALNFSSQFAEAVAAGRKTQTIRQTARVKPGQRIQLYTGQRTKDCRKLGEAICVDVIYIGITARGLTFGDVRRFPRDRDDFARMDGFPDFEAMWTWFRSRYNTESFSGYVIRWAMEESKT
jgi:hypothetical protein